MASGSRDPLDVSVTDFEPDVIYHYVPWDVYRALHENDMTERLRITYYDSTLIIKSSEARYDAPTALFGQVIREVASASRVKLRGLGSTTLWRPGESRLQGSGKEPDTSFHIGESVDRSRGMTDLRLDRYPPPDIAIEVEHPSDAHLIQPIHVHLRVPELWIYRVRPRDLWFGRLSGDAYETVDRSAVLPLLTRELALEALDGFDLDDPDEGAWNEWLREWARGLSTPPLL